MTMIMMMSSRPMPIPRAPLFFLVILFTHIASFKLSYCMTENPISHDVQCPQTEKQALLNFKQSLEDPFGLLSSWNNCTQVNCCIWKGVVCNNFTGHVQQLHLQNNYDPFSIESSAFLGGKISHSLLNLTQLRYLDLSYNNFIGRIPSFIGSLRSLCYLNLSNAGFHGTVPHSIGNLSNLCTLDLARTWWVDTNSLYANSVEWLSGLSRLVHINMNAVNLGKVAANWARVINSLPSLVELHFSHCSLNFITDCMMNGVMVNVSSSLAVLDLFDNIDFYHSIFVPRWIFQLSNLIFLDLEGNLFEGPIPSISNTTKLQHIDLSANFFNSTIPGWLYSCTDLQFVDLSLNILQGTISSAIANLSSLNTLYLTGNKLSGNIPREIASLCEMQRLDLADNQLQGELSDSFGNISACFLDTLQELNLYGNQISGHITDEFGEFKGLTSLDLRSNLLSGAIPPNIGKVMSLEALDLSHNKLNGNLPESLGQLFNLEYIFIRYNKLEGVVTESHFANLTKLKYLDASDNNQLTLKVNPNWIPPFQLGFLRLASWDLGAENIFSWLETQKNLYHLDLSSTGISGVVPNWVWRISELALSHNHLHGKIPDKFGNMTVYLSSNQFSGSLPRVGNSVLQLDLSNNSFSGGLSHFLCDNIPNLGFLHLGGNQLTGEIPDCFLKNPSLRRLELGNNSLSGSMPDSLGFLANLRSLNLQSNKFSGRIPFSMSKCTGLVKMDLHENNLSGNIPTWIGTRLTQLKILILRSNQLSGEISSVICLLNSLRILDLSDNKIFGTIPKCVINFTAMVTKQDASFLIGNTSSEAMDRATIFTKGHIYEYDTILPLVTNMDLSNNNLSGDIPKELTSLVELGSLNLSRNQLTGLIPHNIGDMKQLESLDLSRNSLSGGIPDSFTTMASLDYLNLSYNKLSGRIPESTQFNTFNASSFIGNQLCGPPLTRNCSGNSDPILAPTNEEEHEGSKSKIDWLYVFISSGFAVGFSVVCSTLILNKSWRDAYFGFVEDIWNKLYVFFYIKWRLLARR